MKITLVNPHQLNPFQKYTYDSRSVILRALGPSSTLASLYATVRDHDVSFIDHFHEYQKAVGDEINLETAARREFPGSDVIGISILSNSRKASLDLVRLAHETSNAVVVVGGPYATVMSRQLLENYPIDAVVIGEGERTFPELINMIEEGRDLRNVRGLGINRNGKIYFTGPRKPADNLDNLPDPNYSRYFDSDPGREIKTISTLTSRGCPYACGFCSGYWGRKVRTKSIGRVIEELGTFARHGIETVRFEDDTLTLDPRRAKELFREIERSGFRMNLHMITRFDSLDEELAELYRRVGGKSVDAAIETGSEELRRRMSKSLSDEEIYRGAKILRNAGIDMYLYVMLGFPGEIREDLDATMRMLDNLGPDGLTCSIYHMYPEQPEYEKLKRMGIVSDEDFLDEGRTKLYALSGKELELRRQYQRRMMQKFGVTGRPDYESMIGDVETSYFGIASQ